MNINKYSCKRCQYSCTQKSNMIKHLNRKTKCMKTPDVYTISDVELYNLSLIKIKDQELLKFKKEKDEESSCSSDEEEDINSEKKYTCPECNKSFSRSDNLQRHQKKSCISNTNNINGINNNYSHNHTNSHNIYNINIELKSFYEEWDTGNIDNFLKFALILSNSKYSDTLKCILDNDNNKNVLYNKSDKYGVVYNKEEGKFNNMDVKEITNISMEKIHSKLKEFHEEIKKSLLEKNINIDKNMFDNLLSAIESKFMDYTTNEKVSKSVNEIIPDIYNNEFNNTTNIFNNLKNNDIINQGY